MPKNKFFLVCYGIILILLIIWLMTKVSFIFYPIVVAIQKLFFPFLIAGVMFYLFRPLIDFLVSKKVPRVLGILLLYASFIAVLVGIAFMIGPILQAQVNHLIENTPNMVRALSAEWDAFQSNRDSFPPYVDDIIDSVMSSAEMILSSIGKNLANVFGVIANVVIIAVIVPFILFYLLLEGNKAPQQVLRFLPERNAKEGKTILGDMNKALSTYVQGQFLVCLCVGIMVYIGYLIIGIEYSLILALVAMITNAIPFVGPFIGIFPALIVAFLDSPSMVFWVIVVVVIAQQIESNLVTPQIMGKALDVHPLTIILLLLVAGTLGGILALIIAVPTYAIVKVIAKHSYRLYQLRGQNK
ncbi:AI-2E family transporter [Bacillus horti]|uniref:PurR-regulated permease PerM n=1 Tax=Caldalkalibacillus horti TaxID=77523 RepID=A0ABT9W3E6_9BACI|nr:AI-2E family transporter [Bacillus horti]MDQ0167768.1 putative PurR-regulated permease PerM [Bacillus horti]